MNRNTTNTPCQRSETKSVAWNELPATGPFMRPLEAAKFLGLSRSTLYAMIAEGQFPPFVKLSERASGVPLSWLEAFIAHRANFSTSNH